MRDLILTGIETITAFDLLTGNFRFCLDEIQNGSIAQAQAQSDVTGRKGRKLSTLKRDKTVTISGTNGLVSAGLLEAQVGSKFENKATEVRWSEIVTVEDNEATLTFKAVGTAGAEIDTAYVLDDGVIGAELTQAATADNGKFAYDPTTKKLTFKEGAYTNGTEILVYYDRKIAADVLDNLSDNFSEKLMLYVDCFAEDKCANVYRVQFQIPKADFSGEFTMDFSENQTVHAFSAESLAGVGCGMTATRDKLWTMVVFGANDEDAA